MRPRAFIIGCGRIAGGFNEKDESLVLTHALAYRRLGIELIGCSDREEKQAEAFAGRWAIPKHGTDLGTLLKQTQPEIVSICTPPEQRRSIVETVLAMPGVRCVILEKPLAIGGREADHLRAIIGSSGRAAIVNYFRAFDPYYVRLEAECRQGRNGALCSGSVRYYGAATANASHGLERMLAMFGEPTACRRLSGEADSPLFELTWGDRRIVFLPTSGCPYSPFELDLLFEKKRIRVVDSESRVEHFIVQPDPKFAGYFSLAGEPLPADCVLSPESILSAIRAAVDVAENKPVEWQALLERAARVSHLLEQLNS